MRRANLLQQLTVGLKESGLAPDVIEPILDEAENGIAAAQFIVASGLEKASVLNEALDWYRSAAEKGYPPAKERLDRLRSSIA